MLEGRLANCRLKDAAVEVDNSFHTNSSIPSSNTALALGARISYFATFFPVSARTRRISSRKTEFTARLGIGFWTSISIGILAASVTIGVWFAFGTKNV